MYRTFNTIGIPDKNFIKLFDVTKVLIVVDFFLQKCSYYVFMYLVSFSLGQAYQGEFRVSSINIMQVQHYIKPSKNEIKELDNSYNKKKMEIYFKGFMTLELSTNVQTDNSKLFYVASLAVFTLETALEYEYGH